jgi:hypothetical protein
VLLEQRVGEEPPSENGTAEKSNPPSLGSNLCRLNTSEIDVSLFSPMNTLKPNKSLPATCTMSTGVQLFSVRTRSLAMTVISVPPNAAWRRSLSASVRAASSLACADSRARMTS